jgi:hypothetical protein
MPWHAVAAVGGCEGSQSRRGRIIRSELAHDLIRASLH